MSHTLTAMVAVCCVTVIERLPVPYEVGILLAVLTGVGLSLLYKNRHRS